MVYVGANDGMLHGFDSSTGDEVYAFMPAGAINAQLKTLASPDYEHHFFVDGELSVADVYSTRDRRWKTVLVGSMGRGGRSVFALDITDPDNVGFLWEKGRYGYSRHWATRWASRSSPRWPMAIGECSWAMDPNSTAGTAQLVTIAVESGTARVISTQASGDNALSAVDAWDRDGDGFFDTVYGGDLAGNLWRFDAIGSSRAGVARLYAATDDGGRPQPITAAPLVLSNPDTREVWVFFGTGRYLGGRRRRRQERADLVRRGGRRR